MSSSEDRISVIDDDDSDRNSYYSTEDHISANVNDDSERNQPVNVPVLPYHH